MAAPYLSDPVAFDQKRILTVDDSRAIRAFLSALLGGAGAIVDEAADGREALERHAQEPPYDLILLDLLLPDADGMDILRELRRRDHRSAIVVLTGVGGVASATSAMQAGSDGYIEKQYLTGQGGEPEFFYALRQAIAHREGIVAQQQLQKLKTDFYSMVTHDLRNPAGTVLGLLQLVLAGKGGPLTERQQQLLTVARDSATKFVHLITNYLDYSAIDAGYLTLQRESVDLAALASRSVQQANVHADAKGQTLRIDGADTPLVADVDSRKMEQVVDNLLSNAIKYTPDGGNIIVWLRRDGPSAVISVSDTGQGIPQDRLGTLFTKYGRVNSAANNKIVGTGLGLVITKEIVEAHDGTIEVESSEHGTTFTVRIPVGA